MGVDEKIAEAEYFLNKLKALYPNEDFKYELSAFLSSSRSVADYLLEEYNDKYKLGIPLTEKLTTKRFKDQAAKSSNVKASAFIKWYEGRISSIGNDPIGRILFTERNLNIHRTQGALHKRINLREFVTVSESVSVTMYDEKGNIIGGGRSEPTPPPKARPAESDVSWYFSDNTSEDIPTICEKFMGIMRNLVGDARGKFN